MQLLSKITIPQKTGNATIQLLQGDLTAIPKEHAVDILAISAYPNNYEVVDNATLMAALYAKGIIVADLAKDKEADLLGNLNCWLSKPLPPEKQQQFNFKKILCFEPPPGSGKEKLVANIFRCINNFAFDKQNNIIAMPVLASGNQKVPMEKMLPAILDAAIFWLESGLPLSCIKLVLRSETQIAAALPIFIQAREQYELKKSAKAGDISATEAWKMYEQKTQTQMPGIATMFIVENEMKELAQKESGIISPAQMPAPSPVLAPQSPQPTPETKSVKDIPSTKSPSKEYDFFISYSHKQIPEVNLFVEALLQQQPELNIFYDKSAIPPGGLWIKLISEAIQNSKAVICILSPDYTASGPCWDEFQCAKIKEYRINQGVIKTINFYNDPNLPLIMAMYSYIDCTQGDIEKLKDCVQQLF